MHAVSRGEEPPGLEPIREKLTPKWVRYYRDRQGAKPGDSRWREFQPRLSRAFLGLCAYCEELCKGEVDHFRPKSRYPELVYQWSNWVLACHTCNSSKREQWPSGGYVDPCAKTRQAQPETFFDFDTKTGEIFPKLGLSSARRRKAETTIADLGLNFSHHRKRRVQWLTAVAAVLGRNDPDGPEHAQFILWVASREREFSSIARRLLIERGYKVAED